MNPRKMPAFKRWLSQAYPRLGEAWRRPRGKHSKVALKQKSKFKMPNPSYGAPRNLRFLHPSGFKEVLVFNLRSLDNVDPKTDAVKIAHVVGKRLRLQMVKKAEELKLKVFNP